ncbi:MAG TPA: N-acetylglucosamine-6-phosphate deacetylase [Pyrinomonadaceae bacterium]|jgi:N-acetylglucosamine-6-phosphate deacetylase
MSKTLLRNATIASRDQGDTSASLLIDHKRIAASGTPAADLVSVDVIDLSGMDLLSGFIDVHNHGAVGHDVNASTAEELFEVAAFLARNGVTAWVPTLVPDSDENYRRIIDEIDRLMELQEGKSVAQAVGVHYEGVFASEAMCGALRSQYFKDYKIETTKNTKGHEKAQNAVLLPKLKQGVHMTTLAPEVEGGIHLIKKLVKDGWVVSIGHTRADAKTLDAAYEAGARHLTHFFNAMTGVHHRDIGVAGWGLSHEDVTFDIIADGIHVAPQMLEFVCRSKGANKVSLISDSVAPTGLGDGEFDLWGEKISVKNGRTQNERGSIAGSVITLHDAVKQMLALGFTLSEVSQMASANPAKLLGLDKEMGSIEVGKCADLISLDEDGNIKSVFIGGKSVQMK